MSAPAGKAEATPLGIELSEAYHLTLPEEVSRVLVSPSGRVAVVAAKGSTLWLVNARNRAMRTVSDDSWHAIAAVEMPDSTIEIVDTAKAAIVALYRSGRATEIIHFPTGFRVRDAVKTQMGWVMGGYGIDSIYRIITDVDKPAPTELFAISHETRRVDYPVRLASLGADLLITSVDSPFTVRIVQQHPLRIRTLNPPTLGACADTLKRGRQWFALPAIGFWDGYLQTLTDLASDDRCIVRYGRDGSFRRATLLNVPLAFVGTSDSSDLIAIRNLGIPEVVIYRPIRLDLSP